MNCNLDKGIFLFINLTDLCQGFYCCKLSAAKCNRPSTTSSAPFSSFNVRSSRSIISSALLFNKNPFICKCNTLSLADEQNNALIPPQTLQAVWIELAV